MFGQNKVEKLNKEEEISEQVNQDFLVHNMPSPQNFNAGPATNTRLVSGGELLSGLEKPKHNFKMAGALIILGGLLLIGGLIYASYVFIIKPSAPAEPTTTVIEEATQNPESIIDIINANKEIEASEETLIDDVNVIETITPEILDLATSSASSTLEEITEEVINESATLKPLIDSDNDGMPDYWETRKGLNPNVADHNGTDLSVEVTGVSGYTNLECYLNCLSDYLVSGESSSPCAVAVSTKTDEKKSNEIQIFPNPGYETISIQMPDIHSPFALSIFDNMGRRILHRQCTSEVEQLEISHLAPGIYSILLTNNNTTYSQCWVKAR